MRQHYRFLYNFLIAYLISFGHVFGQNKNEFITNSTEAVQLAGVMVENNDIDNAESILYSIPQNVSGPVELERWFLLGQIEAKKGHFHEAIKIYKKILDAQPDLSRVRFELALCYIKLGYWYRADYNLRLAMAGDDLPTNIRNVMNYYRYLIRQNKNWNVWFNFGAAPDNNINVANGGIECVNTVFGPLCHELASPESAVGYNFILGGNYEFRLGEQWRWKSDANIYSNIYNKHSFDDLFSSMSTGPRYVWQNGDIWLAGVLGRRWYGWDKYSLSAGGKLDLNYDFTRKLSAGIYLRIMDNTYDELGKWLNGNTYSANTRISYSLDSTKYLIFRGGIERETAADSIYSNWKPSIGIGFGTALPYGFDIYIEPFFYWTRYDDARWVIHNGDFVKRTVNDFNQRYSISLSNHKFNVLGMTPTITVSYTRRDSNIWQREYDKYAAEFTFQRRF